MRKVLLILIIICAASCKKEKSKASFTTYQLSQESQDIIGTWKSDDTPDWKLEFKANGTCFWYFPGEPTEEFTYSIETTSPQCGKEVDTGVNFSYIKLINVNDENNRYCYEVLSLNDEYLQIRFLDRGGNTLFKKQ